MTPDGQPESWRELWRFIRADPARRRNAAFLVAAMAVAVAVACTVLAL